MMQVYLHIKDTAHHTIQIRLEKSVLTLKSITSKNGLLNVRDESTRDKKVTYKFAHLITLFHIDQCVLTSGFISARHT